MFRDLIDNVFHQIWIQISTYVIRQRAQWRITFRQLWIDVKDVIRPKKRIKGIPGMQFGWPKVYTKGRSPRLHLIALNYMSAKRIIIYRNFFDLIAIAAFLTGLLFAGIYFDDETNPAARPEAARYLWGLGLIFILTGTPLSNRVMRFLGGKKFEMILTPTKIVICNGSAFSRKIQFIFNIETTLSSWIEPDEKKGEISLDYQSSQTQNEFQANKRKMKIYEQSFVLNVQHGQSFIQVMKLHGQHQAQAIANAITSTHAFYVNLLVEKANEEARNRGAL